MNTRTSGGGPEWPKEDEMLHKIVDAVMISSAGGFETYYRSLQRRTRIGGPSVDEARQDYLSALWSRYQAW